VGPYGAFWFAVSIKFGVAMTTLNKYEYYINLGVSPYQAILWAGEPTLHVSRIYYE